MIEIIKQDFMYSYFFYKNYGIGLPTRWIEDINIEKSREVKEQLVSKYGQPFVNKDFDLEAYQKEKEELEKGCLNSNIIISRIHSIPMRFNNISQKYIADDNLETNRPFLVTISKGKSQTYKRGESFDIVSRDREEHLTIQTSEAEKLATLFEMFAQHLNFIDSLEKDKENNDIL